MSKQKSTDTKEHHLRAIDGGKDDLATHAILESAQRTLALEADGLAALKQSISGDLSALFVEAVKLLQNCSGRVIITGVGKSGHIGQKIAATFASTGTPAFFVHPTEASHGDLGMITANDVILALSWSGETVELKNIITFSRRFNVPMIAITSKENSALGKHSDVVLALPKSKEACPHGLAPTTSTTMQLAAGDCLAIALLESKGFSAHDFKTFHPGGSLGANLKYVSDLMHGEESLPLAPADTKMSDALLAMTQGAFGCVGIVDSNGHLIGVVTDGDLRRHMGDSLLHEAASDIMTKTPKTIAPTMLASAALEMMNASRITALFVVEDRRPIGILHVHDMLRAGVV